MSTVDLQQDTAVPFGGGLDVFEQKLAFVGRVSGENQLTTFERKLCDANNWSPSGRAGRTREVVESSALSIGLVRL